MLDIQDKKEIQEIVNTSLEQAFDKFAKDVFNPALYGTQKQFKKVNEHFEGVDKQFEGINEQFQRVDKQVDKQFEGINEQFQRVDKQFEGMNENFRSIQEQFQNIQNQFDEVKHELSQRPTEEAVDRRLHNMESRLVSQLADMPVQRDKVIDQKINLTAEKLAEQKIFKQTDLDEIKSFDIFKVEPVAV